MSHLQSRRSGQSQVVCEHKVLTPSHCIEAEPSNLLDALIAHLELKNDAALSRALYLSPPMISKLRNKALQVSATVLVRMHDVTGLSIRELRALMGDHRRRFGIND
ncbi:MAG: hypothetical protein ABIT83_23890 [Massilia sp.]